MIAAEVDRLAHAVNALRPDWPTASLRTWITANLANRAYHDAAVALVWVAVDPASHKPARVLENGPWWGATLTAASEAERHPSAVKLGELCHTHGCHKDACGCDPAAYAARQREATAVRNSRGVAAARAALRANQPDQDERHTA